MEKNQAAQQGSTRIQSIDFLRGAVMIIMAIDHVRVYSGISAGGLTFGTFFTRWITHYCAPAFVFFAGTSAFLYLQKSGSKNEVAWFLIVRGLLLVVLELSVIRFFWMFNFGFAITGVIWTLGWCMVLLAAFVRINPTVVGVTGVLIISFQEIFKFVPRLFPDSFQVQVATIWDFFYPSGLLQSSGAAALSASSGMETFMGVSIFYVLIPWIGVMMAGYGFGQLLLRDARSRDRMFLVIGLSLTALFIAGAIINGIYNPALPAETPFLFQVLGQKKYPPSQLYVLMTIGPLIALLPWAQKVKGRLAEAIITIGRVPMFYYLLHILLIHLSAFVVNLILSGELHQEWYTTAPFVSIPEDQRWGLPVLYLVWAIDVVILYLACRWYAKYKADHPTVKWLKYF